MNYIDSLRKNVKEYFNILEPNFPVWLIDYINTEAILRQKDISVACGKIYTNMFKDMQFYSNLEHSIGVALIVWHFTKNKKQTLAGLFHDIATLAFKHCIDFLNGDYMVQESIEDLTTEFIKNSKYKEAFEKWQNAKEIKISDKQPTGVYYVHHGAKIRYINPLVNGIRIANLSEEIKELISKNLNYNMNNYMYLDFNL